MLVAFGPFAVRQLLLLQTAKVTAVHVKQAWRKHRLQKSRARLHEGKARSDIVARTFIGFCQIRSHDHSFEISKKLCSRIIKPIHWLVISLGKRKSTVI